MAIVLRSVKGSNLTAAEVDGNFTDLDGRVTALEDAPIEGVPPSNMTVAGTQWMIYYADGSTFGPFTLPQGNFRPSIVGTLDVSTDGVYAVTSAADFNRFWNYDGSSDVTIDLPATATTDMEVTFCQEGAGILIFPDSTEVTVKGLSGFLNQTGGAGSVVTCKFIADGIWRLIGRVAEDVTV
jgi:hypothetical protein